MNHLSKTKKYHPNKRLWYIRAKEVLISSGSIERPIVFGNNDIPGVMLSSAAKNGARVILAEDKARFGGTLLTSDVNIGNQTGKEWGDGIIS